MDRKYHALTPLVPGTSNPAVSVRAHGGVARNVAETLARLGATVSLVSAVGDDEAGRELLGALQALGVDTGAVAASSGHATAEYAAILQPDNNLAYGIADMAVFETLTPARLDADWPLLAAADWVFADCNLPESTLRTLIGRAAADGVKLAIDAVSVHKVMRLPQDLSGVAALFLNCDEAAAYLAVEAPPADLFVRLAARGPAALVLTLGAQGLLVSHGSGLRALPAIEAKVRDVTGAGDSLVAGTLFGLLGGRPLGEAARLGLRLAKLTVESESSVRRDLTPAILETAP